MKRALILLALLLFAGAWLGEAILQDSGYVLVAYKNTSIETSLWVMAAILIISFAILHWVINVLTHIKTPAQRLRQWRHSRNERKASIHSIDGLKAASKADWWRARRQLAKAGDLSSAPTIFYIEAARMAAKDGDEKECRRLLDNALKSDSELEYLIKIIGAELDMQLGHDERARTVLEKLNRQTPGNTKSKTLLVDVLEHQQDWLAIAPMLPDLRKKNILSEERAKAFRLKYAEAKLKAVAHDLDSLNLAWEELSFDAQQEMEVKLHYIGHLKAHLANNRIETLVRGWLNNQWDERLLLIYSQLPVSDSAEQLSSAKAWYKKHPESATLELCLARISRKSGLWGAAIQHYRQSLELSPAKETELELVELYLQLGEPREAETLLRNSSISLQLPAPTEEDRKSRLALLSPEPHKD